MNTLFLFTFYRPDRRERARLERLQEEIDCTIAHIKHRTVNDTHYKYEKNLFHQKMRKNLRVIDSDQGTQDK